MALKEWYDTIYNEVKNPQYEGHYLNNDDYLFWKDLILKNTERIIDIGCGVGQFAHMLHDKGFKNYVGIDFSSAAILKCVTKNLKGYSFICSDIFTGYYPNDHTYICLEVLEHIENDTDLFQLIPVGNRFIASVPDFDSMSHVRFFKSKEQIIERYSLYLDIEEIIEYKHKNGRTIFIVYSKVK